MPEHTNVKNAAGNASVPRTGWQNIGEFQTVGQLRRLLESFGDDCPLGFIHQSKQDLFYRRDEEGGMLGFQPPANDKDEPRREAGE